MTIGHLKKRKVRNKAVPTLAISSYKVGQRDLVHAGLVLAASGAVGKWSLELLNFVICVPSERLQRPTNLSTFLSN